MRPVVSDSSSESLPDDYAEFLATRGGIANCGGHLAVWVAPLTCEKQCPAGWVFVPLETATTEVVREALTAASAGRSQWPNDSKTEAKPK